MQEEVEKGILFHKQILCIIFKQSTNALGKSNPELMFSIVKEEIQETLQEFIAKKLQA